MKKLLIIITLAGSFNSFGQKFKDIYPELVKASDEDAVSIIKSYMIEDLDHPTCNLRLALIYERGYKNANPITEFEKAMANAEEAKLRFSKSTMVVDEKEINKNTGYYVDFASGFDSKGRPIVAFSTINEKIRGGYDSAKQFTEQMPIIYDYFTKSVDFHDKAIKAFNEINGQFTSRDKLLLLYNSDMKNKLNQLMQDYDSSIYNLEQYMKTYKSFAPNNFKQKFKVNNIETYRLQGLLTSPSFLIDNIEIWNYKLWAQEIINEAESEVSQLRSDLNAAELGITKALAKLNPLATVPDFTPYTIDNKLIFSLIKYDNQSLPVAALRYKQFKQTLVQQQALINDRDTTTENAIYQVHLGDLIYYAREADSLLTIMQNRSTEENIEKYDNFFRMHYNGLSGVNQFIEKEKQTAKQVIAQGVADLYNSLKEVTHDKGSLLNYKGIRLSTIAKIIAADSIGNSPYTMYKKQSTDGSTYLSGLVKSTKKPNHTNAFMAKVSDGGRVAWYKEFSFTTDNTNPTTNEIGDMAITPEGCGILVRARNAEGMVNHLLYLNENGEEIFSKALDISLFPRSMQYVEATNAFIFAHKGATFEQDYKNKETAALMSINILGDVMWSQQFDFAGNIVDIINVKGGFMLIGNYAEIADEEGKTYRTRINTGQTNAFAARFTLQGKLAAVKPIESANNYFIHSVVKVNDKIINLLGNKGSIEVAEQEDVHLIVNQKPGIIHTGF